MILALVLTITQGCPRSQALTLLAPMAVHLAQKVLGADELLFVRKWFQYMPPPKTTNCLF